jgi:hypothetical protein
MTKTKKPESKNYNWKRIIYPLLFVLLSAVIAYNIFNIVSERVNYRAKAIKVEGGWGFQIKHKNKVLINQPFIPGRQGKVPFPDRKSAITTGRLVIERIESHTLPLISPEDLIRMGLDSLVNP